MTAKVVYTLSIRSIRPRITGVCISKRKWRKGREEEKERERKRGERKRSGRERKREEES